MKKRIFAILLAIILVATISVPAFAADESKIFTAMESEKMWNSGLTFAFERGIPIKRLDLSKYNSMDKLGDLIISYLEKGDATSVAKIIADPSFVKLLEKVDRAWYYRKGENGKTLEIARGGVIPNYDIKLFYGKMKWIKPVEEWPEGFHDKYHNVPRNDPNYLKYPDSLFTEKRPARVNGHGFIWGDYISLQCNVWEGGLTLECNTARNGSPWHQFSLIQGVSSEDNFRKMYGFYDPSRKRKYTDLLWGSGGNWRDKSVEYMNKVTTKYAPNSSGSKDFSISNHYGTKYQSLWNDNMYRQEKVVQDSKAWYDYNKVKISLVKETPYSANTKIK